MIKKYKTQSWIIALIVLTSCFPFNQSKGQYILPAHQGSSYVPLKVITSRITRITNDAAVGWVEISGSLNNATTKGICWSRNNSTPNINDDVSTYNGSNLNFSVNMTNMDKKKTYFARAFVTYGSTTSYGNIISFVTGDDGFTRSRLQHAHPWSISATQPTPPARGALRYAR